MSGKGRGPGRTRTSAPAALPANGPLIPRPFRTGVKIEPQSVFRRELWLLIMGTIHLFRKPQRSYFGKLLQEFRLVAADRRSWKILLFGVINLVCTGFLLMWCSSTNSVALTAYTYLTIFDLFRCGGTCLESPNSRKLRQEDGKFKPSLAASTSWLQEHVADLSRSLCGIIPGLSSIFLPRMNPFVLIDLAGAFALCITYMLIEINNYFAVDTASAIAIALMTFGTMYPMSVYSGKVLLQTTPPHVIGQLDKLIREAGSVHVRIRRDANEQMVLAHVTNRLYTLVSTLTVQIFKDDWIRPALVSGPVTANVLNFSDHHVIPMPLLKNTDDLNPVTSTPAKPSSPPPEFSFNTPGKNVSPVILLNTQTRPYGVGLNHGHTPYSMFNQGLGVPGIGATHGFRTGFTNIPSRYGSNNRIGQPRP
ncbi:Zinc transporter 6 [Heterocephalus glaber]|uniref:Zinc transporter 6 n=1 Tax=Heterocephalus glaber TaxID=10181 RepID=G5B3Y5_HETGA|nr:Zinc transporter 6 [Heterocephalus glaber]